MITGKDIKIFIVDGNAFTNEFLETELPKFELSADIILFNHGSEKLKGRIADSVFIKQMQASKSAFPKLDYKIYIGTEDETLIWKLSRPYEKMKAKVMRFLNMTKEELQSRKKIYSAANGKPSPQKISGLARRAKNLRVKATRYLYEAEKIEEKVRQMKLSK